jgi:hypothetical protein
LSFERKDAEGFKEDEEASLGETLIYLSPGTWEITASAYTAADPPLVAARAVNTLTRTGDLITGDAYFALEPAGTGPGILRYAVTPPGDIALDAALSRIRIEQDGAALAALNDEGFSAGSRPISAAITGSLSLEPGHYVIDIVLDDGASSDTAAYRTAAAILPGLVTEIIFAPEAADFLDPDVTLALTGAAAFGRTQMNSSGTAIGAAGGAGADRTQAILVPRNTETVYFTLTKTAAQTLSLDAGAEKVLWTESGSVDGSAAGGTRAVCTVDTADLAEAGGDRVFAFALKEAGKTPLSYTVTVTVPRLVGLQIKKSPEKLMYIQGTPLDITGMEIAGFWSDGTTASLPVSEADINGFDSSQTGEQRLWAAKNGIASSDDFTITVYEREAPGLFFDHGLTSAYEPSPDQYYTVPAGRTVVLAPVKRLIPEGAVYEWKVDGAIQGSTGEYFPYTGTASSGTQTVTVTAKLEGAPIAGAATVVAGAAGASRRGKTAESSAAAEKLYSVVAPGQFGATANGFGGFGGYAVYRFDHSVEKKGVNGGEIKIGGNAFASWNEPGAVWVSQDDNSDGLPNDTWYELKGSHTLAAGTVRRYALTFRKDHTWVDNIAGIGTYPGIQRWPTEAPPAMTELTLVGTRLDKSTVYIANSGDIWGYADVIDDGRVSLSNAIQADGQSIDLPFIDFLKIVTAVHDADATFGERSTEPGDPTDRSMGDPNMLVNGTSAGGGQYRYRFTNNSGYDLTISFNGTEFSLSKNGGTTEKYSANPSEYIDFYGGNATMSGSAGQVTFTNG